LLFGRQRALRLLLHVLEIQVEFGFVDRLAVDDGDGIGRAGRWARGIAASAQEQQCR